ncbi:MAG: insulinase family protein [Muribaculaceae bacterium]|nr:insulinase family protein [Muribaculaceae bacterium]
MVSEVTHFTLDNGLRIVHQQDDSVAMATLNVLYDTGARDEDPEMTGMAHLIEHLMFSGSANVPDYDGELQMAGGVSNAWTSNDFTNFYCVLPAVNVETAFRLESDRMLAPAISEENLNIQRSVVIEEFKQQCLNQPYGDMWHHLRGMAYRVHPYRWPVIGLTPEHLERVSREDVTRFLDRRYSPANAVLAVTGNVSLDDTRRMARKWMGDIPPRPVAERTYRREPEVTAPRYAEAEGNVPQTAVVMCWPMDRYGTKAYHSADALTDVLSNGESSRFYRNLLVGTDLFSDVDASIMGSEDEGLLIVKAMLRQSGAKAEEAAIRAVDGEIGRLTDSGVTAHELERAANKFESNLLFSNLHFAQRAQTLAADTLHGEPYGSQVEAYRSLTTADLEATARTLFTPDRKMTLIYRPANG